MVLIEEFSINTIFLIKKRILKSLILKILLILSGHNLNFFINTI